MGAGTFFKVGGTNARQKTLEHSCGFNITSSQALKYYVIIYTPHVSLNYTILDKIKPLWKRIGEPP